MDERNRRGVLGCLAGALVFVLVAAGILVWMWNEAAAERQRTMIGGMPPGWTVLIRQRVTLPQSVIELEPRRARDDNGALAVYDSTPGVWTVFRVDSVYERLTGDSLLPEDSFTIREAATDTALDRWVRWADAARWEALDLELARSGALAQHDLLAMRVPDYRALRSAMAALAVRGWQRAEHGQYLPARRDFSAAIGIGTMLVRHEPTLAGFLAGRVAIHDGAQGLMHLALLTRDGPLADQAADAAAWSAPSTAADYDVLAAAADTALRMAGEPQLALGWRAEAMAAVLRGPLQRPWGRMAGLPARTARSLDSLAARTDGDASRLAKLAAESARTINNLGIRERMRRFGG